METKFTIEDAKQLYGVDNWGAGYFDVSPEGHLLVLPTRERQKSIDVRKVIDGLVAEGRSMPVLLRFPQILSTQVRQLCRAFAHAIDEFNYSSTYHPVYPIKVNQQRSVVEEILRAGRPANMGLEVGSKTELMVALAQEIPAQAFVSCNGFKDAEYIQLALHGRALGKNVIVVIERMAELETLIHLAREMKVTPLIGMRLKPSAKGSGKWEKSSGYLSKFGLSTAQLLDCIGLLEQAEMASSLRLLHFHIGSQVPDIRRIKSAIKEAAIVYAKIAKKLPSVDILNVGGGLGVDYDGSKTASDASVNYTIEEFANDVVYTIREVCQSEQVREPRIVTETGRVMTAYHSVLVFDALGAIRLSSDRPIVVPDAEPEPVVELDFIRKNINSKNAREYYHDAVQQHDELLSMFNLGYCELESRARGELLFWDICHRAVRLAKSQKLMPEEFELLENRLAEKAICNFSVFQSVPDSWALDMLFPVIPVSYLNRRPTRNATLVDLTCDSDGEIDHFVDLRDIGHSLPIHDVTTHVPYYMAVLLIGAYQEVLGDYHNLFGAVTEAHVVLGEDGRHLVTGSRRAQSAREIIRLFGYDGEEVLQSFERSALLARDKGLVSNVAARTIVKSFADRLDHSSYLAASPPPAGAKREPSRASRLKKPKRRHG